MSKKESYFTFDQQHYDIEKETSIWKLSLKQSDVHARQAKELAILNTENDLLLPLSYTWLEDTIDFEFTLPQGSIQWQELNLREKSEKIRALINLGTVQQLLDLPLTFFIHPENMVFDLNLMPKIAYRGVREKMPPQTVSEEALFRQYQSLIVALMDRKKSFTDLYEGNLDIYRGSSFAKKIIAMTSFSEINSYLLTLYQDVIHEDRQKKIKIKRSKYQTFKQFSIWFGILMVLLAGMCGYFLFFREPFQAKVLASDTAFLKTDYDGTISILDPIATAKIPYAQKYTLAYSFIQGKELTDKQKQVILNNISLKSDEQYLDYWIENGRGHLDEALDIAKTLQDSDLLLYGLMQKIEQVRNDSSLKGSEREEKIEKYESDYEKYNKKRQEKLDDENKETDPDATGKTNSKSNQDQADKQADQKNQTESAEKPADNGGNE